MNSIPGSGRITPGWGGRSTRSPVAWFGALIVLFTGCYIPSLLGQKQVDPARFESAIQSFEKADAEGFPGKGGIVFVGSSSIRMWKTIDQDFEGFPVLRRGFGGSHVSDVLAFLDRTVLCYEPRATVVYAGDNDIAAGKSPETVAADFKDLVARIHAVHPASHVLFIAIKPSLKRWHLAGEMGRANDLIREYARATDRVVYLDIFNPMLGDDGQPLPDVFLKDGLHLNAKGYAIWTHVVRPALDELGLRSKPDVDPE